MAADTPTISSPEPFDWSRLKGMRDQLGHNSLKPKNEFDVTGTIKLINGLPNTKAGSLTKAGLIEILKISRDSEPGPETTKTLRENLASLEKAVMDIGKESDEDTSSELSAIRKVRTAIASEKAASALGWKPGSVKRTGPKVKASEGIEKILSIKQNKTTATEENPEQTNAYRELSEKIEEEKKAATLSTPPEPVVAQEPPVAPAGNDSVVQPEPVDEKKEPREPREPKKKPKDGFLQQVAGATAKHDPLAGLAVAGIAKIAGLGKTKSPEDKKGDKGDKEDEEFNDRLKKIEENTAKTNEEIAGLRDDNEKARKAADFAQEPPIAPAGNDSVVQPEPVDEKKEPREPREPKDGFLQQVDGATAKHDPLAGLRDDNEKARKAADFAQEPPIAPANNDTIVQPEPVDEKKEPREPREPKKKPKDGFLQQVDGATAKHDPLAVAGIAKIAGLGKTKSPEDKKGDKEDEEFNDRLKKIEENTAKTNEEIARLREDNEKARKAADFAQDESRRNPGSVSLPGMPNKPAEGVVSKPAEGVVSKPTGGGGGIGGLISNFLGGMAGGKLTGSVLGRIGPALLRLAPLVAEAAPPIAAAAALGYGVYKIYEWWNEKKDDDKENPGGEKSFGDKVKEKASAFLDHFRINKPTQTAASSANKSKATTPSGPLPGLGGKTPSGGLGSVSAKYESGKRGVATVSSGKGDAGGVSYGAHQLSTQTAKGGEGSMAKFLKSPEGAAFAPAFAGMKPGSEEFNQAYKQVAASNGEAFGNAQHEYIKRTHYDATLNGLGDLGENLANRGKAVQEAIFSTAVQYGPGKAADMLKSSVGDNYSSMSDKDIINALYDRKASGVNKDFKSSSDNVKAGVAKRVSSERADLLSMVEEGKTNPGNTVKGVDMLAQTNVKAGVAKRVASERNDVLRIADEEEGKTNPTNNVKGVDMLAQTNVAQKAENRKVESEAAKKSPVIVAANSTPQPMPIPVNTHTGSSRQQAPIEPSLQKLLYTENKGLM